MAAADPLKVATRIFNDAIANTKEQNTQFKESMSKVGKIISKAGETLTLSGADLQRYNNALTAPRVPTVAAPGGEISVPEPE